MRFNCSFNCSHAHWSYEFDIIFSDALLREDSSLPRHAFIKSWEFVKASILSSAFSWHLTVDSSARYTRFWNVGHLLRTIVHSSFFFALRWPTSSRECIRYTTNVWFFGDRKVGTWRRKKNKKQSKRGVNEHSFFALVPFKKRRRTNARGSLFQTLQSLIPTQKKSQKKTPSSEVLAASKWVF